MNIEELKATMRRLSNSAIADKRRQGEQMQNNPTAEAKEIGRLIVKVADDIMSARAQAWQEQASKSREYARIIEQREDERKVDIMARAIMRAQEMQAAADKTDIAKERIKAVLSDALKPHIDELYSVVTQTAHDRKQGGKRAAAQMLYAAYSSGDVNTAIVPCFTEWLDMWQPIAEIPSRDANYKAGKITEKGYYKQVRKFSSSLQAILYPESTK